MGDMRSMSLRQEVWGMWGLMLSEAGRLRDTGSLSLGTGRWEVCSSYLSRLRVGGTQSSYAQRQEIWEIWELCLSRQDV